MIQDQKGGVRKVDLGSLKFTKSRGNDNVKSGEYGMDITIDDQADQKSLETVSETA